jgi:hypothetical protein
MWPVHKIEIQTLQLQVLQGEFTGRDNVLWFMITIPKKKSPHWFSHPSKNYHTVNAVPTSLQSTTQLDNKQYC